MNVLAVLVSLAFLAVWMGNHADARDRRRLLEWTTDLRRLSAEEFEWLVGEIHRREGWRVEETGSQDGPDGNVDLILTREGTRVLVQCKRWQSRKVGTEEVRSFAGVLRRNGESASGGIFVTLSRFTEYAEREARELGIALVDGTQLHRLIEQHRRSEMCPECDHPMRLDKSRYGWWFRCTKHGCSGKRDLSAEPHRAIELLTMLPPAARR